MKEASQPIYGIGARMPGNLLDYGFKDQAIMALIRGFAWRVQICIWGNS